MSELKTVMLGLVAILAMVLVLVFLVGAAVIPFKAAACSSRWDGRQTEYSVLGGCRVYANGGWWPESAIKVDPR